jgi:1,5-anhydro-D-fructose reductase (1,5-anhydro-D-mannitol-forming)
MSAAGGVRWGLVGASAIAREWVLPAMRSLEGHEPVGVYSSDRERGRRFAQENGLDFACAELSELLEDPTIDAVYISTTNERHLGEVRASAAAGKHILCEKPLALSGADARAAVAVCEEAGLVLGVNHHFRNDRCVRVARRLLTEGAIGRPLAARVSQAVLLPEHLRGWRTAAGAHGGGAILDLTVHDVDTLRFVLDDEVEEVTACSASQVFGGGTVEDAVVGTMRFRRGVVASFYDAYNAPDGGSSLELHGTEGSIVVADALDERLISQVALVRGGERSTPDLPLAEDLYAYGLRRFAEAVAGTGAPAASGRDGVRALAVALAVRRAATERAVVAVRH